MTDAAGRHPMLTVVIPTHDRPTQLRETVRMVLEQIVAADTYEIVIVDDGSDPHVTVPPTVRCRVIRLEARERSAARNAGAAAARAEIVLFVDDDISVPPHFVAAHLAAHREWPGTLVIGAIVLPEHATSTPFGRFRQALEARGIPSTRGPVPARNLCTAANMSVDRTAFRALGGFDESLTAGEDQDFALQYTARGGRIVFVPDARVVHRDDALDLRSYCRRVERGSEAIVAFCRRHPDWPDNVLRERVNGRIRWRRDPMWWNARKLQKRLLASGPMLRLVMAATDLIERLGPDSAVLARLYRVVLGAHIFRGYRRGLCTSRGVESVASGGPVRDASDVLARPKVTP